MAPYIRPYIPRFGYRAYQAPSYGTEFQGGFDLGNTLMQGIAKIRQQQQMDAIANALLNQANPPRAALVDPRGGALKFIPGVNAPAGTDPNAPVPTTGTAPASGGLAELQLRQQMAQQDLADQLRRAQIENVLAQARGTGRYAKVTKPTGPTPAQVQAQLGKEDTARRIELSRAAQTQTAGTDTIQKLAKDFDADFGKGTSQNYFSAYRNNTGTRGNIVNGRFVPDENGDYYVATPVSQQSEGGVLGIGAQAAWPKVQDGKLVTGQKDQAGNDVTADVLAMDDLQPYLDRLQRIQAGGGKYVPPMVARALPVTQADILAQGGGFASSPVGQGGGGGAAASNVPAPSTQDEYDALPSGSQFIDGDGQLKVKP